jgi:hypothetical protein
MPPTLRHRALQCLHACVLAMAGLLVPCAAGPARASIPCATALPVSGPMADFSLLKQGSLFHIFYTTGVTGNRFGHLVSTDLYHWRARPDVMVGTQVLQPTVPDGRNGWNRDRVWAPSIVQHQGLYYMFYTGVRTRPGLPNCLGQIYQSIGIATSTDLENWRLENDPTMSPAKAAWTLQDTCAYEYGNFRDPFVTQDPASGEWLMYYTTIPNAAAVAAGPPCVASCSGGCNYQAFRFVLGVAHAPAGFSRGSDWNDLQPLWCTYQTQLTSNCFRTWESPHAFRHVGPDGPLWYLMATAGTDLYATDLVCLTSTSPTAAPAGWTYHGHLEDMGVRDPYGNELHEYETLGWIASEYLLDPTDGREYLANVRSSAVQLRQILWRADGAGFDLVEPFRLTSIELTRSPVGAGTPLEFTFEGRNCVDAIGPRSVVIEVVRLDESDHVVEVIRPTDLGLPSTVTLTGDHTVVPWVAREWPAGQLTRLQVRLKDTTTTVASGVFVVDPALPADVAATDDVRSLALRLAGPSPATGAARFECVLPAPTTARIELFAVDGRRVRALHDGPLPAGARDLTWDLRDAAGRRVDSGVYFARLVTPLGTRTTRLVITRGE